MVNALLYRLTAGLPCRLIYLRSGPYLERYYVGRVLGWTVYLHRFVSSDPERHLHNHPWRHSLALVLAGGYVEDVVTNLCAWSSGGVLTERRKVRWFNAIQGAKFHRISAAQPGTWTLFAHGPRQVLPDGLEKGWGFLTAGPGATTVFTPAQPSPKDWHITARKGRDVGRVPL